MKLNLTQTELAQKIRAKQKSIFHYETGASIPTIETLIKIANVLARNPPRIFSKTWTSSFSGYKTHLRMELRYADT